MAFPGGKGSGVCSCLDQGGHLVIDRQTFHDCGCFMNNVSSTVKCSIILYNNLKYGMVQYSIHITSIYTSYATLWSGILWNMTRVVTKKIYTSDKRRVPRYPTRKHCITTLSHTLIFRKFTETFVRARKSEGKLRLFTRTQSLNVERRPSALME